MDNSYKFIYKQQRAHKRAGTEPQAEVLTEISVTLALQPLETHFPLLQDFLYETDTSIPTCGSMCSANDSSGKAEEKKLDHFILTCPQEMGAPP